MKAIHQYLFQDVYEWAGQERGAPPFGYWMTTNGVRYYPARPPLTEAAEEQYARLAEKNYLQGLGRNEFVHELAEFWGEINVVHSLREGNTRSQFVFCEQLTDQAGFQLNLERLGPDADLHNDFIETRQHGQHSSSNDGWPRFWTSASNASLKVGARGPGRPCGTYARSDARGDPETKLTDRAPLALVAGGVSPARNNSARSHGGSPGRCRYERALLTNEGISWSNQSLT